MSVRPPRSRLVPTRRPRTPIATDRGAEVQRGRRTGREHQDVAIVVRCPPRAVCRSDERRPGPGQPAQPFVEVVAAGAERAELESVPDVCRHVGHDERAEAGSLSIRQRRDRLDVAGPERPARDVELALDNRRMGDDLAIEVEHEMEAADGMGPVIVGEPLLLVRPECGPHHGSDGGDLGRGQLIRWHPAHPAEGRWPRSARRGTSPGCRACRARWPW